MVSNIVIFTNNLCFIVQGGVTDAIDLTTFSSVPVGENLTDDTKTSGILNNSHPSVSSAHEATVLDQSGLGSIQSEGGHFNDGKIAGEVCANYSCL